MTKKKFLNKKHFLKKLFKKIFFRLMELFKTDILKKEFKKFQEKDC